MAWAALGKGLMGAGRVVGGAARAAGGGARMARRMFRRKGGKDAPEKPASEQTVDVEAQRVRPSSALVPFAAGAITGAAVESTSSGGDDVEEIAIRIKTNLISVEKLLKDSAAYRENIREQERIKKEKQEAADAEKNLEKGKPKKKNKFKLPVPREVKSFWGNIKDFLMKVFLAQFMDQIINMRGPLITVAKVLAKVANVALDIIGWIFNVVVTIVDGAYKLVDGMRGLVKNIFGEKGLEVFDSFLDIMVKVINAVVSVGMVFTALGGVGMVTKLLAWLKGGAAIKAATGLAGAAGGAGGTGGAAGVAGMGGAATVGVVAGVGLLASGLGEGAFQIKKKGQEAEADWFRRYKEKKWYDPRKAIDWGILQIMKAFNFITGTIGVALDIIGAPFRYLIELVRYPFLDEEGKAKQRENLAKFDARIREQFREIVNAFTLGLFAKEKGAFGSIYGKEGTDAMGYTKDGKTKSQQVPARKGQILLFTPDLVATQDLLDGKKSGERVHTIAKIMDLENNEDITDESKKPKGLGRVVAGVADFMTLGMFDFDQRNRKGAPKDFGIRRIAGGLADYATLGITDFDKRGAGLMQVDPMFGGKDKAWGSRNEQAKRGEKQSGFGLKRGIGGALDFATAGVFDFDKQNPVGSPKGFGPLRILAGLTDWMTMGLTDFDQRGAGNFQFDPISGGKDKRWGTERQRPMRSEYRQRKIDNLRSNVQSEDFEERELRNKFSQLQMNHTVNPDGSITSRGSGRLLGGELFRPGQPLTQRQYTAVKLGRMASDQKYSDEVLRSYAMYEEQNFAAEPEVIFINKNTTVPVRVGGTEVVMTGDGSSGGISEESYASYQGH